MPASGYPPTPSLSQSALYLPASEKARPKDPCELQRKFFASRLSLNRDRSSIKCPLSDVGKPEPDFNEQIPELTTESTLLLFLSC